MTLMVEPGRAADETVAQDVGKTVAVPNSTPTDAVELAWSNNSERSVDGDVPGEGVPSEPAAVRQSWRATWRIAGLLVVAGLVLAGAIVLGRWVLTTSQSPAKATNPPAPTASAPPAPPLATATAPSSIASTRRSGRQVHTSPERQGHLVRQPRGRHLQRQDGVSEHWPGDDGAGGSGSVSCEQSSIQ